MSSEKVSVKDCVDADHEAKVWFNIRVDEKTGLREIILGKNKQNYKRLAVKVKFDPISHNFIKVKDLIEEEENAINGKDKNNKYKKIGESGGIPVYGDRPQIIEYESDVSSKCDDEDDNKLDMPDIF